MRWFGYLDPIWTVRGSLALPPGRPGAAVLDQLGRTISAPGTICARTTVGITIKKTYVASQDPLASFHRGCISVCDDNDDGEVKYAFSSRILGWCFLAPFAFATIGYWSGSYPWSDQLFSLLFLALFAFGRRSESRKARTFVARAIVPCGTGVSDAPPVGAAEASVG